MSMHAQAMRVVVDGVDISHMVRGFSLEANVGQIAQVSLELVCEVGIVDGVVHLTGYPSTSVPVLADGKKVRVLAFEAL